MKWTTESAMEELDVLVAAIGSLASGSPFSSEHARWVFRAARFLEEVFGGASLYYVNFRNIRWRFAGTMMIESHEIRNQEAVEERYDRPVYARGLAKGKGILLAAKDELARVGVDGVYSGKDTGPEASLVLKVINLGEVKLRKVIRQRPVKEQDIQDAFETLLIGADVPYSREAVSIEYSSKTYKPDFTVEKADLAIELKLCGEPKREKALIAEINDDILAYATRYGNLLFLVYDCGFIRDSERFIASFEANRSVCVRIVKH